MKPRLPRLLLLLSLPLALSAWGASAQRPAGPQVTRATPPPTPTPVPTPPPKPSLSASFQRGGLRENDPLPVLVLVANESAFALEEAKLDITAPDFLEWRKDSCGGEKVSSPLELGTVPARKIVERKLCLRLTEGGRVGDFNIHFRLSYAVTADGLRHESFVTAEKALKVDVFGTDNVAGVPLAFAVFVVPGMFFWLTLRLGKVPYAQALAADEKLMLSVIVSTVCLGVAFALSRLSTWWPLAFFDPSGNVSIAKLLALAATGVVAGALWSWGHHRRQERRRRAEQAMLIDPGDGGAVLVRKILALNPKYNGQPIVVRLKDGQGEYVGAHWARTTDAHFLVGSFTVDAEQLPPQVLEAVRGQVDSEGRLRQDAAHIRAVLDALGDAHAGLVREGNLIRFADGPDLVNTGRSYYKWGNDEVSAVITERHEGCELLRLDIDTNGRLAPAAGTD